MSLLSFSASDADNESFTFTAFLSPDPSTRLTRGIVGEKGTRSADHANKSSTAQAFLVPSLPINDTFLYLQGLLLVGLAVTVYKLRFQNMPTTMKT